MPTPALSEVHVGLRTEEAQIPLEHVDVRAEISGAHARVTFTQRYRNQESNPVEAVYVFPLDESGAVCGFAAVVDGVRYEGVVKPREEAFAAYDDAMAAGHGAFLLDEERPDVFTASIGNLAPGAEAQIELSYVTELAYEGDSIRFTLPTTVSPRYAPAEDQGGIGRPQADVLNPPHASEVPYGLSFTAHVKASGPIRRIESPSHPLAIELGADHATVTLAQQQVALDRDLVLLVTPSEVAAPQIVLERSRSGRVAAAVTFRPQFAVARVSADIVFVVDRSGSMEGSSIEQVRNALQICLRSLEAGCNFNIVGFGSRFESLFGECRPYDERSLADASSHVSALRANLGGTELLPALEFVLEQATRSERIVQIVVMTDGQVTNTDAVIEAVRRRQDRVRVFTFGIGRGASHHLVKGLARAGGGAAEFVYPGERIEPKIVRLFRRALSPALTDVRLDWGGMTVTSVPSTMGPVFADEPLRAYGLMPESHSGTVTLHAREAAGPLSWSLDVRAADVVEGATIGTLAARARIREIEEGGAWSPDRGSQQHERRTSRAVNEIIQLATEFGLASRETSWVAVQTREVPLTEQAVLRRVPVAITCGWGGRDAAIGLQASMAPRLGAKMLGGDITESFGSNVVAEPRTPLARRVSGNRPRPGQRQPTAEPSALESMLSPFRRVGGQTAKLESILGLGGSSSVRALDRLVALQQADGSWDLSQELADVLGLRFGDLVSIPLGNEHTDEARRALATALAITFLETRATSQQREWELLAAKATRWLTRVNAVPPGGESWRKLASNLLI
jgi:Ca-activated chloride channel family protein